MVYWSPHSPSNSEVAGSNPGLGGPFSIFFSQKRDNRWRNWWQWKPGQNRIVELEIINFRTRNFTATIRLKLAWNLESWGKKKSNFPVCTVALNWCVLFLHKNSKILLICMYFNGFSDINFPPRDHLGEQVV